MATVPYICVTVTMAVLGWMERKYTLTLTPRRGPYTNFAVKYRHLIGVQLQ